MGIAFPTYVFFGAVPATVTTYQYPVAVSVSPIGFAGPLARPVAPPY